MNETKPKVEKNQPAHEIRIGAVKAVIWANKVANNGTMHNVVPVRIYRDEAGEWHETHSFDRDCLLVLRKVLDMAHTWICEAERK